MRRAGWPAGEAVGGGEESGRESQDGPIAGGDRGEDGSEWRRHGENNNGGEWEKQRKGKKGAGVAATQYLSAVD